MGRFDARFRRSAKNCVEFSDYSQKPSNIKPVSDRITDSLLARALSTLLVPQRVAFCVSGNIEFRHVNHHPEAPFQKKKSLNVAKTESSSKEGPTERKALHHQKKNVKLSFFKNNVFEKEKRYSVTSLFGALGNLPPYRLLYRNPRVNPALASAATG